MSEKKVERIQLRVEPSMKEELEEKAKGEKRTLTGLCLKILAEWIEDNSRS